MKEAIILCGGKSTRFRPYTDNMPKALVKINGKAILDHQIEWLRKYGYKRIILACGYQADKIKGHVLAMKDFAGIKTITEKEPLGTGGAIKLAMKHVEGDKFLVVNGDNISNIDLTNLEKLGAPTLTVTKDTYRFGIMVMLNNGDIKFTEKPQFWINAGVSHLSKTTIGKKLPDKGSIEELVYPNIEFKVYYHNGKWHTFDSQRDKEEYEMEVKNESQTLDRVYLR